MAQLVRCLLCKPEELSSDFQHPCKNRAWQYMPMILRLGRQKQEAVWDLLARKSSQIEPVHSRFSKKPCLKKYRGEYWKKTHDLWHSHASTYTYTYKHIHLTVSPHKSWRNRYKKTARMLLIEHGQLYNLHFIGYINCLYISKHVNVLYPTYKAQSLNSRL